MKREYNYNIKNLFCLSALVFYSAGYAQDTVFIPSDTVADPTIFPVDTSRSYTTEHINDSTFIRYYAPEWHDFITNIPGDVAVAGKTLFSRQSVKPLAIIAGTTALLYMFDRPLVDGTQKFSRDIGLDPQSRFESFIKIGDIDIMQVPGNLNTGFYFFGEGWTSVLLFSGIGLHGAFTKNNKEVLMLSQFIEGYIEMGITVQILKRSFGRQTPRAATTDRGKFQFFPPFSRYQKNVSHFDAMPSGHMATMAFTVTLLSEHYPDNIWIRPVGYTLMGICGLSMLNNGVHWASDYPLGFGIGYLFAKIVSQRGKVVHHTGRKQNLLNRLEVSPTFFETGESGIKLTFQLSK
ncbi:MAG: phosphatase PAP2 family protein [Dysgonamonadaceae bacterium]|jgi:membrane-associated phospholipid phosphatase|nr:phosphatase PAP2 family protein [Dysgonamonadaceae bacterium]